jgi:hypothetical protein
VDKTGKGRRRGKVGELRQVNKERADFNLIN